MEAGGALGCEVTHQQIPSPTLPQCRPVTPSPFWSTVVTAASLLPTMERPITCKIKN